MMNKTKVNNFNTKYPFAQKRCLKPTVGHMKLNSLGMILLSSPHTSDMTNVLYKWVQICLGLRLYLFELSKFAK